MKKFMIVLGVLLIIIGGGILIGKFVMDQMNTDKMNGLTETFMANIDGEQEPIVENSGNPIAVIEIPRFGDKVAVTEGVDLSVIAYSAGHFPETPLPWDDSGNSVFAAHNDTFFKNVEKLVPGDKILIHSKEGSFEYRVTGLKEVDPSDVSVLENVTDRKKITLVTCNFTGSTQVIAFAEGGERI